KHEFPSDWHKFLHPKDTDGKQTQTLLFDLTAERFPFQFQRQEMQIQVTRADLFLKLKEGFKYDDAQPLACTLIRNENGGTEAPFQFMSADSPVKDLPHAKAFEEKNENLGRWAFVVQRDKIPEWLRLKDKDGKDVVMINNPNYYQVNPDAIEDA